MAEADGAVSVPARTSHRFNLISATLAFALWGGWAYYVNALTTGEGTASPLTSGLTQGTGSFLITLVLVRAVAWLYHRLPPRPLRLVLPGLITVTVTGTCLATAHALVGTPDIVQTVAPPLSVALAFCIYTAFMLRRAELRTGETRDGGASTERATP
jgi:hypothetical protein